MTTIGERCLPGANNGGGIALGDDGIIEAWLYVTTGTLAATPEGDVAKAKMPSGRSNMLFRRNHVTGGGEVIAGTGS